MPSYFSFKRISRPLQLILLADNDNQTLFINKHLIIRVLETQLIIIILFFYPISLLNQIESIWYTTLIQIKNENFEKAKNNIAVLQKLNPNFKVTKIKPILNDL